MGNSGATGTRGRPKRSLADRVYDSLYGRISNGDYPLNQKLPSENALSKDFGVSRPVLRMALEKLRAEGVVYSRQGAGNFVRAATSNPVGFARVATLADVQRCYEFRITLEAEAAQLAAERHNKTALGEITAALDLMRDATGHAQHLEDADFAFHVAITKAANNSYFEASMHALRDHIYVGMKLHGQSLMTDGSEALEAVLAEHTEIYSAICKRDASRAGDLMRNHLDQSRARLFGSGLLNLNMIEQETS